MDHSNSCGLFNFWYCQCKCFRRRKEIVYNDVDDDGDEYNDDDDDNNNNNNNNSNNNNTTTNNNNNNNNNNDCTTFENKGDLNKQCLFNKIISAKAYCALKKNSISCVLTIPSFFKSFRRGLTKLGNRINRLLSCVISYVIHSVDDGCTVETYLLILKKVALFLKNYVTPLFQTGVFCREGGTSS